jgi:hypothetical protein
MFSGKGGANPPGFPTKIRLRWKSLLGQNYVNYGHKSFITLAPGQAVRGYCTFFYVLSL